MLKLPEAPDRKRRNACVKKEAARALLAVTSRVTTPKCILLQVEGTMRPSLDNASANFSISSSRLFY